MSISLATKGIIGSGTGAGRAVYFNEVDISIDLIGTTIDLEIEFVSEINLKVEVE